MTIEWRTVAEFPQYIVSNEGEVRRAVGGQGARVGRPLKWHFGTTTKYPNVRLTVGGVVRARCVHKLVSRAFLGPMPEGMQVRHLDGDTMNCRAGNLAYGTHKENQEDKVRHGTSSYGEKNPRAKLTAEQAKAVGQGAFKKHFLGLSDNVTFVVEQLEPMAVNTYHYRVIFKPQAILPDVDARGDVNQLTNH